MKEITALAMQNVLSGAQTGAGTYYCGTCGRYKPEARFNSRQCREHDHEKGSEDGTPEK